MDNQTTYGDERIGYTTLVRDMTPQQARRVLEHNMNDGIYMQMSNERRIALHKRAKKSD